MPDNFRHKDKATPTHAPILFNCRQTALSLISQAITMQATKRATYDSVEEYIEGQSPAAKKKLTQLRKIIRKEAPDAEESISYGLPAYRLHRMLVYFGAFKNHYSLVALPSGIRQFSKQLKKYKCSKSTVQFPYDEPLPTTLITAILRFRIQENQALADKKRTNRP